MHEVTARKPLQFHTINDQLAGDFETLACLAYEEICEGLESYQNPCIKPQSFFEDEYDPVTRLRDLHDLTIIMDDFGFASWNEIPEDDIEHMYEAIYHATDQVALCEDVFQVWDSYNLVYETAFHVGIYGQNLIIEMQNSPLQEVW